MKISKQGLNNRVKGYTVILEVRFERLNGNNINNFSQVKFPINSGTNLTFRGTPVL